MIGRQHKYGKENKTKTCFYGILDILNPREYFTPFHASASA
jgi:hypothetical protein